MGLDAILECENHRQAGQIATNVCSSYHDSSKVEEKDAEEKPTSRSYLLGSLNDDFGDLSISPCRRSMPCRPVGVKVEDNEVFKRGSVYQSSREVRKLKKLREDRRKLESAFDDEAFLSFEIVNHTSRYCQNEPAIADQQKRAPLASLNAELNSSSLDNNHDTQAILTDTTEFLDLSFRLLPEEHLKLNSRCSDAFLSRQSSSDSYLEICLFPDGSECSHAKAVHENVERCLPKEPKFRLSETFGPENDNNIYSERNVCTLPKSFSAKAEMTSSVCQSENDLPKARQRTRFSPIRKMLDPIKKSKSQRNPSLSKTVVCNLTSSNSLTIRKDKISHKSLLGDLSSKEQKAEHHDQLIDKDQQFHDPLVDKDKWTVLACSPAHLNGTLKLESKQGVPSFEFCVKDLEDVLYARTWKTTNAFNWVYTFHSGKKNSSSGWGTKDRHRQSLPMVGQMQVSCYFCSELSSNGSLDNSAVTEFVLYDISHVKRSSFAYEERCPFPEFVQARGTLSESLAAGDSLDLSDSPVSENCKSSSRTSKGDRDSETSTSCPWAPADLLPHLEVAAIVIQIPFGGKRTLKDRLRDDTCNKQHTDFPGISMSNHGRDATFANPHLVNVKMVTSSGRHGLPCNEEGGPSPLLDRWRSGGRCDCGGWDMTCPITILDNYVGENTTDIGGSHLSLKLFVQGAKDKMPSLTITTHDDGQYSVDFHAQFSKLQAFSICVAVLHSLEAFGILSQEKNGQKLHSNSLKLLLEEEVRHLIEVVAKEEQKKVKRKLQEIPAPHLVDPPFSPMGRV